jgi:hypothetical protein
MGCLGFVGFIFLKCPEPKIGLHFHNSKNVYSLEIASFLSKFPNPLAENCR